MVTATDDQSDRLAALETGVSEMRADLREHASQTNARLTALETGVSEMRADLRQVNDRIDRVFYAVIVVGAGIIGAILTLTFRLT